MGGKGGGTWRMAARRCAAVSACGARGGRCRAGRRRVRAGGQRQRRARARASGDRAAGGARGAEGAADQEQIGQALGFDEVQLAVQKGAAGELPGCREPERRLRGKGGQASVYHRHAAVNMELSHILACVARRSWEPQHKGGVEGFPCSWIHEGSHGRKSWGW